MSGSQVQRPLLRKYTFKNKMRNILAFIITAALAASCLGTSVYNDSYTEYATFEYANNYQTMFNTDSLYFETQYGTGFTWTNYLAFGHRVDIESAEFEGGFLLSYLSVPESGNTELLDNNAYRANQTYTAPLKNTYLVFTKTESMPEKHFWFNYVQGEVKGTCLPQFMRVNNTVEVINAIKESFQDGDVMILKATGYLGDKTTGEAEIRLAEFTSSQKDSIVTSWTIFELTKLGIVDKVNFDFILPEGSEVPQAVCMDDFTANLTFATE